LDCAKIGVVVGLGAEARLLRHTGFRVEVGGGDPAGAARAANRLIAKQVIGLISFGLAGGLNPACRPGAVIIPAAVIDAGEAFNCDRALLQLLGGGNGKAVLASQHIAETALEKHWLFNRSGADAVDLESGAVARAASAHGLAFAVLRAIADPAERDLPPAALMALNSAGDIKISAVLGSVLRRPGQIPALLEIARDAAKARAALIGKLREIEGIRASRPLPA
jgi:adenosylhomocysteine nucleosidase